MQFDVQKSRFRSITVTLALSLAVTSACSDDSKGGGTKEEEEHDHDHDAAGGASSSGGAPSSGGKASGGSPASGGAGTGGAGTGGAGTGGAGGATTEDVAITFAGVVGGKAFDCESTYPGVTKAVVELVPLDFRFYVSDVRLIGAGGVETPVSLAADGKWQTAGVALVDFENGKGTCANGTTDVNAVVKGTIPAGDYTGLAFRIGVPEAVNHDNPATAPSPLNVSALEWDWTYGYKFMKVDFAMKMSMPDGGTADAGMPMEGGMMDMDGGMDMGPPGAVFLHVGSNLCTAPDGGAVRCENANRAEIRLATFGSAAQKVVVDYAAIVAAIDPAHDLGGTPGCMSGTDDPECASMFAAIGLDLATGEPKSGQTAFKAAAK